MEHCWGGEQAVKEQFSFEIFCFWTTEVSQHLIKLLLAAMLTGSVRKWGLTPTPYNVSEQNSPPCLLRVGPKKQPVISGANLEEVTRNRPHRCSVKLPEIRPPPVTACYHQPPRQDTTSCRRFSSPTSITQGLLRLGCRSQSSPRRRPGGRGST